MNFGAVKFETKFTEGSPVIDICAFAKDHDVDLIITSTHGFTGFTHVLIGSIAETGGTTCPARFWWCHLSSRQGGDLAKSADAKLNQNDEGQSSHEKGTQAREPRVSPNSETKRHFAGRAPVDDTGIIQRPASSNIDPARCRDVRDRGLDSGFSCRVGACPNAL